MLALAMRLAEPAGFSSPHEAPLNIKAKAKAEIRRELWKHMHMSRGRFGLRGSNGVPGSYFRSYLYV